MSVQIKEMHLRDYWKILRKRRTVALIFGLATVLLVALYTFTATPQYEGATKILIEKVEPSDFIGRGGGTSRDPEFYQTQLQVIKSRAVAERILELARIGEKDAEILGISSSKESAGIVAGIKSLLAPILGSFGLEGEKKAQASSREDKIIQKLMTDIRVRPVGETHIVSISFLSPNPEFSALIANTTAKAYIEETLDMKMESTRRTLEWMNKKADSEREKLEKAEQALQAYMRSNDIVTVENRNTITPEELSQINSGLVQAESRRKQLEALNNKVRQVLQGDQLPETVSAIASDTALQALRAQIVTAEKNIMELSNKYGSRHPVMEKARQDLNVLERKKDQEIQRIVQSIQNEYELALANENNLRSQLQKSKGEALRLNEKFVEYGSLLREVETGRQIYDALMMKIKEQSVTEETNPVNTWIVEQAKVPTKAALPMVGLNLLIGLALGAVGGIALAFVSEYLDNTIKEPAEAEEGLKVPVLGVISKGSDRIMEDVVLKDPLSPHAENYKGLRTALLLSSPEQPPKKVLITSSVSGEGKTTTAVNLAMALAQSEKQVAIIDCDMRKPRLHKVFKLNNKIGLSSYLAGASDQEIFKRGPLANLTIVTAGPIPPNPSELLMSERMRLFMEQLGRRFDIVICDSPPVLAVEDARILSRVCDGSMLVLQAHRTTFDMAGRSVKAMRSVSSPLLGLVVNGLDVRKSDYHYYYYQTYAEQAQAEPVGK